MKILSTFLITGAFFLNSQAASFDCSKAQLPAEKMVCDNAELSLLDEKLAKIYSLAKEKSSDQTELKNSQIKWISDLRKCNELNCMQALYSSRITDLQNQVDRTNYNIQIPSDTKSNTHTPSVTAATIENNSFNEKSSDAKEAKPTENDQPILKDSQLTESTKEIKGKTTSTPTSKFTEELGAIYPLLAIAIIVFTPFIPGLILKRTATKKLEIVFASSSEMKAYITTGIIGIISFIFFIAFKSNEMKAIGATIGLTCLLLLISLLGFQIILTPKIDSAAYYYSMKILFVAFGSLIIGVLFTVATFAAMSSQKKARRGEYGSAAIDLATSATTGYAASNLMSKYFGSNSIYINGSDFPDIVGKVPDTGLLSVFSNGFRVFKLGKNKYPVDSSSSVQPPAREESQPKPKNRF